MGKAYKYIAHEEIREEDNVDEIPEDVELMTISISLKEDDPDDNQANRIVYTDDEGIHIYVNYPHIDKTELGRALLLCEDLVK